MNKRSSTRSISLSSVVILSALLLLTGCSPTAEPKGFWGKLWKIEVGPDYKRPDAAPVQEFRSQIGPAENASLADLPWWSVFKDPQLQQLVVEALARNYDLQLAVARVDQARSLVWVAASPFYPQSGLSGVRRTREDLLARGKAGTAI